MASKKHNQSQMPSDFRVDVLYHGIKTPLNYVSVFCAVYNTW
jgi:hypothetical protein